MSNGTDMRRRLGRRDGAEEIAGTGGKDEVHGSAGNDVAYDLDVQSHALRTGGFQELDLSEFSPLDAINWFSADNIDVGAGGIVKVYFATAGQSFGELADNGFSPLPSFGWNAFEKQQMMLAFAEFGKILGYTYVETTNSAEAEFRLITTTSTQYGAYFYPQDSVFGTQQGIGVFNVDSGNWDKPGASQFDTPGSQISLTQGGFAFAVMLHELGHAHGLAHPHDTGGGSEVMLGVTGPDSLGDFDLNQGVYTVMSYNDAWQLHPDGPSPFTLAGLDSGWSGTLSAFDIAVLQQRYGINNPYATGNSVYTLKDAESAVGTYYETIWDTGGTDEIRYIGTRNVVIDLTAATLDYSATGGGAISFVDDIHGGYTIANGVVIENGTGGSGNDTILGNSAANILRGEGGNDQLIGGGGNDYLVGGAGSDVMQGGAGDDTYYVDGAGDVVGEAAGQGYDRVAASASYTLAAGAAVEELGAENVTATTAMDLTGNELANLVIGNHGVNVLRGEGGNDTLSAGNGNDYLVGGSGNDVMYGEAGDDTYYVDAAGDTVGEAAGQGYDRVAASVSYALAAGSSIEELGAENVTATTAMDLTGNELANLVIGNHGVNILRGEGGNDTLSAGNGNDYLVGGAGNDVMYGEAGDDTYYVDAAGDTVGEAAGQGYDRVAASASYALAAGASIEELGAENVTATTAMDLTGNELANLVIGNHGVNILRGEGGNDQLVGGNGNDYLVGGSGNDVMYGEAGDDTYYVDGAGDVASEGAGQGSDRVAASVSYTLAAGTEVERLEAENSAGTDAMDLTGNAFGNAITGNAGVNVLDGKGGNDVLAGLGGADTFAFTSALGAGNVDQIADFAHGTDKIALDDAVFAGLTPGALAAGAFVVGGAAADADDRIVYNSATGQLFFDADGNGAGAAVQFASLVTTPTLSASDFTVI